MYKSIIIKIMILSLCVFIVGCAKKGELKTDCVEENFYTVEDIIVFPAESGEVYVEMLENCMVYNASGQLLTLCDQNGKNINDVFNLENGKFIYAIGHADNQNLVVVTKKEGEEDYQYECIEVDLTGERKETRKMEDVSFQPKSVIKDNKGRWIILSYEGDIYVYDNDSKIGKKIERKGFVESICFDADEQILVAEKVNDVYQIVKLKEDLQNGEEKIVLNNNGIAAEMFVGQDGKNYFFEENYLYCFDLNQKRTQPVLRWIDGGVDPDAIRKVSVSKEGNIYVAIESDGECVIKKLTPVIESSKERQELVLACVGLNSVLREQILKFNNESDDYKISIRDYGEEEDPYQVLHMDIITGKQFDILCMDGLYAQNYIEKGLLEDLSRYIDENEYVHAYIEAIKNDGGIYQISPYFSILTILGKTKQVGDKNGWTSEEMIAFLEDNSDTRGLLYYDESDLLGVFIRYGLDDYLQEDQYGKHFQREPFQNVLKFIKNYQDYALKNESSADIPSTDMIYRGDLLLLKGMISSGYDYRMYKSMFHSDITAKGYPVANGYGNYMELGMPFAICSKSGQKEAAWDFISYVLSDKMQYNLKDYGFPVKRKVFEQLYDEWCGNVKTEDGQFTMTIEGKEQKVPYMNEKDINNLEAIIESSAKLCVDSPELVKIIQEESQLYFEGQQDLENTGKYIEKRVNTFLEERK